MTGDPTDDGRAQIASQWNVAHCRMFAVTCSVAAALLVPALLASPVAAQPSPAPSAEDVAAAYANAARHEREQIARRIEQAAALADGDAAALLEQLRRGPGGVDEATLPTFTVTLHGCAPAAPGEVGHVCHYSYSITDPSEGVSFAGPDLVRGHLFPGPDGLLVRELPPPPEPYGPRPQLGAAPGPAPAGE